MNENGDDLVARVHREAVERYREQRAREKALVEATHRAALEQYRREQSERERAGIQTDPAPREARMGRWVPPMRLPDPGAIHYTELPEAKPDNPLCQEWNFYRREAGRLLAEKQGGRYVLIKGEQLLGIWDTETEALMEGYKRFQLNPFLVHRVQEHEPLLFCHSVWRCHS